MQKHAPVMRRERCSASRDSFMKQAGEGADYLEGCEGARSQRCFKCGAIGHWAAECRGLEVQMTCLGVLGPSVWGHFLALLLSRKGTPFERCAGS